ncbi:MAG: response regulator [Desulfovibrionaceae bacterium]
MNPIDVLLVDDEEDFLDLMHKRLSKRNLIVRVARSGEEALQRIDEAHPDVVVLDVKMPGMDGIEALRRIKECAPEVEILMLTGHANVEAAAEGMNLGALDFLIKPVAINELLAKLNDAYRTKQVRAL